LRLATCAAICSLAAAKSSELPAFCCVTLSSSATPLLIWPIHCACSRLALAI